jgi:hypothetical protein
VPSAKSHPAYKKWAGGEWNEGKPESQHFTLDIDHDELHEKLKDGWRGPDRWWRHMVTVEDAKAQGCNLFDIEDLRARNSKDAFENKYLCRFIDDAKSAFSLALLLACGVEPGTWKDFNPALARPFGNKPVAVGYDPSRTGDHAAIVVMAVPVLPTDKWRLLERIDLRKVSYQYQANRIKELLDRYNVVHIGVDVTGEGRGVYPYIEHIPCVVPIMYNVNVKCDLVTKALDVIQPPPRLEFDIKDTGIVHAFLMIRKTITDGTNQITYTSARNTAQGHADVAWAVMHAMIHEPINPNRAKSTVVFSN